MKRLVLALELLCALLLSALGWSARPAPVAPFEVQLALLGARETAEGSWVGVDLLATPDQPVERLLLYLLAPRELWVSLEELTPQGAVVLHRERIRGARVFPSAHAFYEVKGSARLRLTVTPVEGSGHPAPAPPLLAGARRALRLSDGARFEVIERALRVAGPTYLELGAPALVRSAR